MVYLGTFNAYGDGTSMEHLMHVVMVYFGTFNACANGIFWNI